MTAQRRKIERSRIARRVLLGALLAAVAIYYLVREMGLDGDVILDYLLGSMLLVGAVIVLALAAAALMRLFRKP